jgi:hypothetical protein
MSAIGARAGQVVGGLFGLYLTANGALGFNQSLDSIAELKGRHPSTIEQVTDYAQTVPEHTREYIGMVAARAIRLNPLEQAYQDAEGKLAETVAGAAVLALCVSAAKRSE